MKNTLFITGLIAFTMFISSTVEHFSDSSMINKYDVKFLSEITYQKVFHDNIWWIVVYQDGVKINEYPDIDSM